MIRKQEITTFEFPENAIIWDVRDASSFSEGHIQGAINQPIDSLNAEMLSQVAPDQTIYVLCGGGSKAPRAAEKLESLDNTRDYVVLMGGTRAARAGGLALVQDA